MDVLLIIFTHITLVMEEWVYPKSGFRVCPIRIPWRNGLKESWWGGAFLHFLPNFCYSWWFFKVEYAKCGYETLKNHQKIWQKMKKSLVQLAFNPFFGCFWVSKKSNFVIYIIKYGKKWRQVYFNLLNPIFRLIDSGYPKIGFWVPVQPLYITHCWGY